MFDGKYGKENGVLTGNGYYHDVTCAGERGIDISFYTKIQYIDLEIHTRRNCCADRYQNVCLYYFDEENAKRKIACTPADLGDQGPDGVINFKDFNVYGSGVFGSTFHLRFEDTSGALGKGCAAIEELYFSYQDFPGNYVAQIIKTLKYSIRYVLSEY